jgi:hypothetical protein
MEDKRRDHGRNVDSAGRRRRRDDLGRWMTSPRGDILIVFCGKLSVPRGAGSFLEAFRQRFGRSRVGRSASELLVLVCVNVAGDGRLRSIRRSNVWNSMLASAQRTEVIRYLPAPVRMDQRCLHLACSCQCIGHAPKPWPSYHWLSFREMHGWSRQHHPSRGARPQRRIYLFYFPAPAHPIPC